MKKIIKLTESDLTKLVKRVLKEQGFDGFRLMPTAYQFSQEREREKDGASQKETPKANINPKNLELGDGGESNPDQVADVKRLQQKLMDLGFLKTPSMKPTGYFGEKTQAGLNAYNQSSGSQAESFPIKNREEGNAFRAWANDNYPKLSKTLSLDRSGSFNNEYIQKAWNTNIEYFGKTLGQLYLTAKLKGQVSGATAGAEGGKKPSTTPGKTTGSSAGFIIIFAFPTYKPALEKGDVFSDFYSMMAKAVTGVEPTKAPPFGHGGCVIIDSSGSSTLYEFGRYGGVKQGYGKVISANLGKIAKIQNGRLMNASEVASKAKAKTQGLGPQQPMEAVVLDLPNPSAAASYANVKEREYDLTDMSTSDEDANCGTFALQVGKAGGASGKFGAPLPPFCAPAPIALIATLRPLSLEFIKS
jgi:peptidoglycan hydrolase-like protein with peptidoglycan-binding domain